MRPEMFEYQYDWMLSQSLGLVDKLGNNSQKEIDKVLPALPYFENVMDLLLKQGEITKPMTKLLKRWAELYYRAEEFGWKRVMTTFMVSPTLLHAMKVLPINAEIITLFGILFYQRGANDFMDFCVEKGFTETSCSGQRGALGAYLAGLAKDFDAVVINSPGTCDTNANAFAYLASSLKKPFYAADNPSRIPGDDIREYHRKDTREMISFIEQHTGQTLDYERLSEIYKEVETQQEIIAELNEMMMLVPCPMSPVYSFILYFAHNLGSGLPEFTELLKAMHKVVKQNADAGRAWTASGEEKARMYMIYLDHYNTDLAYWSWLEKSEISHLGMIVASTYHESQPYVKGNEEMGWRIDTSSPEAMIDTYVEMNARMPMARSVRGPMDGPNQWLEESLTLLKMYKSDATIFSGSYGCRNCWSNVQSMAKELEKHGFPTLICTADAIDERSQTWKQTKAQMEEFLTLRGII